jgi:hypothetical protein
LALYCVSPILLVKSRIALQAVPRLVGSRAAKIEKNTSNDSTTRGSLLRRGSIEPTNVLPAKRRVLVISSFRVAFLRKCWQYQVVFKPVGEAAQGETKLQETIVAVNRPWLVGFP